MRILWCSNSPLVGSGYGAQTKLHVPRLSRLGHPTAILAYYGIAGGLSVWNGIPLYPPHIEPHGQDVFGAHAVDWKADIGISLMDLWVCHPDRYPKLRYCPWFPVDQFPLPEMIRERARQAWQPIVMSRFGLRMAEDAEIDAAYVPHAYDPHAYYPMEQAAIRDALGVPRDAFIVGMVAANVGNVQPRKAWHEQIEGFALFKKRHPDALLMLHTSLGLFGEHQGVNIGRICEQNGLVLYKDVLVCDQYRYILGFDETHMRATYNAMDVLLSVSRGEGFGVPILEAQACGTPVIVGDWTAMSELCFAGWKVDKADAMRERTMLESYWYVAQPGAIAETLEAAYDARGEKQLRKAAVKGAKAYQVDEVARRYWKPLLTDMQARIDMGMTPEASAA